MIQMLTRTFSILALLSLLVPAAVAALAPDAPKPEPVPGLQGRPDIVGEELLGGTFQNPQAGIAFRTPVNCVQVKPIGDQIARFTNEKAGWELTCTRSSSLEPMPLTAKEGEARLGLLEIIAARLKQSNPGVDIVRQEVEDLGEYQAGIIAARLSGVGQRKLFQQAMIQANDQLYYSLTMTSPAAKDARGPDSSDAGEMVAVESFRQMLETVKLLDRTPVKRDQDARLIRTRALFVTFTPQKLRDTLIPEQWMRLIHDGKDIGYTYIVEEPDAAGKVEGIRIGIRSRSYPDAQTQVDGETWYICTSDRRHENWSNLVWVQNLKTKQADQITEIGSSDRTTRRQAEPGAQLLSPEENPKVAIYDTYELNVKTLGKSATGEPVKRSLPPFYIPQAIGHLLPRLLPTREPKTFLFATYVSDRREVMLRYVDVGSEQEVDLAGQRVNAVPITDRIGAQGSPTIHYIDPAKNKYLGSVNPESKITVLPTDREFLRQKWIGADLSRPREAKETGEAFGGERTGEAARP